VLALKPLIDDVVALPLRFNADFDDYAFKLGALSSLPSSPAKSLNESAILATWYRIVLSKKGKATLNDHHAVAALVANRASTTFKLITSAISCSFVSDEILFLKIFNQSFDPCSRTTKWCLSRSLLPYAYELSPFNMNPLNFHGHFRSSPFAPQSTFATLCLPSSPTCCSLKSTLLRANSKVSA